MNKYPYRFVWHPRGKYKNLYKQRCRVLARGIRCGNNVVVSGWVEVKK